MRKVLKYPGSKWRLAHELVKMIPDHHTYCEPFAGSMALLFTKTPSPIEVVNDLDSDVVNLFRCIQQDSERLARPALEVIRRFDFDNVFMYLDPPYLLKTRSRKQYAHEMTDVDHEELLQTITRSKAQIILSGYASEMYDTYLRD